MSPPRQQAQQEKEKLRDPVYPQAVIPMHPAFAQEQGQSYDQAQYYGENLLGDDYINRNLSQSHKITGDVRTYHAQANGPSRLHSALAAQANGSEFAVINQITRNTQYEDSQQSVVNQQLIGNSHLEIGNHAPQSLNAQTRNDLPAQSHAQQVFGRQSFASPAYRQLDSFNNFRHLPFNDQNIQYNPYRNQQQLYQVPEANQYQQIQPISNIVPDFQQLNHFNNFASVQNAPFVNSFQGFQGFQGDDNLQSLDNVHSIRAEFQPEINSIGSGYSW